MVVTHLPSNILLIFVPLLPNLSLAVLVLLLRFSISQMDVPTRQAYTMSVVPAEERSAAGGFTGVARTTGAAISPLLAIREAFVDQCSVLHCRCAEDSLRPFALQGVRKHSACRGTPVKTDWTGYKSFRLAPEMVRWLSGP
jgi:hypothetical protein